MKNVFVVCTIIEYLAPPAVYRAAEATTII